MQPACTETLLIPWAVLPDRLPFIRLALGSVARDPRPTLRPRFGFSTNTERYRRAGNSAIVVLPLHGISLQRTDALGEALGFVNLWRFTQAFRAALADHFVSGIVIDIDSPGGSVYGVAELADEIYRARGRKPIAAIANSLAASGAYWIGSAASEFYVTPGGEVGSIGVVAAHQDFSKALGKAGIETTLISAGRYKVEGNPFAPLGSDARRYVQARVDEYFGMFVRAVARNRGVDIATVRAGMGQGRVLSANAAKAENMVDGIATFDDVLRMLAQRIALGTAGPSATRLHARQRLIGALDGQPLRKASRTAASAAVHRQEVELLAL
ncbi:S49 family peptidase [Burkholderia pseudomallei]|uniref:S49 family peptidase n=1 Tax=Burkholderia pseudomallei TaxID=28450 RepID=UPI002949A3FE|nr:S49 family peptidase [Burkholderia pseudomallei]CAJ9610149.1 peptidase S49 [Burkholderia pseudomallei]